MRAKLVTIVAILWVAAVGAITVYYAANRPVRDVTYGTYLSDGSYTGTTITREFNWGAYLGVAGITTLVAAVAVGIIVVATRKSD